MRSSGDTKFGLVGSVVHRTKSRIACLAGPSFHEGNAPIEMVWADADTNKGGADRAGSNTSFESKLRRSIPDRIMVFFMFCYPWFIRREPRCADIVGNDHFQTANGN